MAPKMTSARDGPRLAFRTRLLWSLGVALLGAAVGPMIWGAAPDKAISDLFFRIRGPLPSPSNTVIVGIDDQSFASLQLRWPWPRRLHAELIGSISSARVIVFDLLFDTLDPNGDDMVFARSIANHPNVILSTARVIENNEHHLLETWLNPIQLLGDASPLVGSIELPVDAGGVVRQARGEIGGRETLGFLAAREYAGADFDIQDVSFDINFLGPAGTVETIAYHEVLNLPAGSTSDPFRDKLVFVGITSEVGNDPNRVDRFKTPFSRSGSTTPGVEIHANIAFNLLSRSAIGQLSPAITRPLGALLACACGLIFFGVGVGRSVLFFVLVATLLSILGYLLFSGALLYVQVATLLLPLCIVFITGLMVRYYETEKSEKQSRKLLENSEARISEILAAQNHGREDSENGIVKVFLSYSHKPEDSSYMAEILEFLKGLQTESVEFWSDKKIIKGDMWEHEIMRRLDDSDIAVALVSQSYLDSDYCNTEIKMFLDRGTVIVPVILSPCEWNRHAWLSERQFIPAGGETIAEHYQDSGSRQRIYLEVRDSLREHAGRIRASSV